MLRRAPVSPGSQGHYIYQFVYDGTTYSIKCGLSGVLDVIHDFTNKEKEKIKIHMQKLKMEKEESDEEDEEDEEEDEEESDEEDEEESDEEDEEESDEEDDQTHLDSVVDGWPVPAGYSMFTYETADNDTVGAIANALSLDPTSFWNVNNKLWQACFTPTTKFNKNMRFYMDTRVPYMSQINTK